MLVDHSYIQYAFNKEKERVSIFDVPYGKNCACVCRICGEPLGARNKGKTRNTVLKPNQKVPHFYHLSKSNCKGETLIHILAKEIFSESKKLMLTIHEVDQQGFFSKYIYQMVHFDEVILEKKIKFGNKEIQPDAIGKVKGKSLFVEFAYSHCVEFEKTELLQEYKKACVEIHLKVPYIDWNELTDEEELRERIRRFLHEDGFIHQTWIYNPKYPGGNRIEIPKEIDWEKELYLRKLERQELRVEELKKVFQTNSRDFIMEVLTFEQRRDLLDDEHFIKRGVQIIYKESSLQELKEFIKDNYRDWDHIVLKYRRTMGGNFDIPQY